MAEAADVGIILDNDDTAFLFGEDQARYLIACNFDEAEALMIAAGKAGVTLTSVGKFQGDMVRIGKSTAPLAEFSAIFRGRFGDIFD